MAHKNGAPADAARAADHPQNAKAAKRKRRHDWQAIERDYRTGKFTLKELEAKHGSGYAEISRRAKRDGWTQDLRSVVRQATSAALIAETTKTLAQEAQTETTNSVLAAAEIGKDVILGHRSELREARSVALDLLAELRGSALLAEQQELLAQILAGEGATPQDEAQARATVQRALGMGSRISSVKALAEAITKLHTAERVAFDLDDDKGKGDPQDLSAQLAGFIAQIHESGSCRLPVVQRQAK